MIRPAFSLTAHNPLSLRGRVRVGAFLFVLASALIMLLAAACGSGATEAPPAATEAAQPEPTAPSVPAATAPVSQQPTEEPEQADEGHQPTPPPATAVAPATAAAPEATEATEQAAEPGLELSVILATTVLEVGEQRVAFLLATPTGLVKGGEEGGNEVSITPVYLPDGTAGDVITTRFHQWPYGVRGAFATEVDFDRAGQWRLDISAEGPDAGTGSVEIDITEDSTVPFIGSAGPPSENKTLSSVGDLALITTDYSPDPALYQVTIREAVDSPLPAVVVFASPAFCTTATCGPQVDAVSELRESYDGQAHFIHVEIYDNPDEIQGDLDRAEIAPTVDEWGLTGIEHWFNESWTFILDPDGLVTNRFEGFATVVELEESLQSTLN